MKQKGLRTQNKTGFGEHMPTPLAEKRTRIAQKLEVAESEVCLVFPRK